MKNTMSILEGLNKDSAVPNDIFIVVSIILVVLLFIMLSRAFDKHYGDVCNIVKHNIKIIKGDEDYAVNRSRNTGKSKTNTTNSKSGGEKGKKGGRRNK